MKKILLLLITYSSISLMGMEKQIIPSSNVSTIKAAASLHVINAVPQALRMEEQPSARRLQCPKISCPSCSRECIGTMCCCVIFPALEVPGAIIADTVLCPFIPCIIGYLNRYEGASDSVVDIDNYCLYTRDALKSTVEISELCCDLFRKLE
jgi:hypothetical protein